MVLGIRPEQLAERRDTGAALFEGTVAVVEPMGADTVLWVNWNEQTLGVRIVGDFAGRPGDRLALDVDLNRASLFDAATGLRLAAAQPQ